MVLQDCFSKIITGEWGEECNDNKGTPIIRTTNFLPSGKIDYSKLAFRSINQNKLKEKALKSGDIILEKSGGTDTTPVGRVVYCDERIDESVYLCNNFTQAMRVDREIALPKFMFYCMHYLHQSGKTDLLQNKTTGIRNLRMRDYLNQSVALPSVIEQHRITTILDKAIDIIALRKKQCALLDLMVKSRFVEMFGDIKSSKWELKRLDKIATSRLGKMLDSKRQTGTYTYPYLANFNVQWFSFNLERLNEMDFDESDRKEFSLEDGDLLVCEGGDVGRTAVWHGERSNCYFQKALHRVRCNLEICLPEYIAWVMYFKAHSGQFDGIASAATIAHLPGVKLKALMFPLPPLPLQTRFADFVRQVEKSKFEIQQGLKKLELQYNALMQQYFG